MTSVPFEKNPVAVFVACEIEKAAMESNAISKSNLIESGIFSIGYASLSNLDIAAKLKAKNIDAGMAMEYVDSYAKSVISEVIADVITDKIEGSGSLELGRVLVQSLEKLIAIKLGAYFWDK